MMLLLPSDFAGRRKIVKERGDEIIGGFLRGGGNVRECCWRDAELL
jgi:hypothetical protein